MIHTNDSIFDILNKAEQVSPGEKFNLIWDMIGWIDDDHYYESAKFWVMHWLQNTEDDVRGYCVENILHNMKEYLDE